MERSPSLAWMNNRARAGARAWSHAASVGLDESHPVHAGSHKQTVKNGSAVISLLGSRTGWRPAVVSKPGETRLRQRRLSCDHCVCLPVSACVCQAQVWAITDMCVTLSECGRSTCSVWMFRLFDLRPGASHTYMHPSPGALSVWVSHTKTCPVSP